MNKAWSAAKGSRRSGLAGLGPALLLALALVPWTSHAQGLELPDPDGKTPPLKSTIRAPGPRSVPEDGGKSGGGSSSDPETRAAFRKCLKENPLNMGRCFRGLGKEPEGGTLPGRVPGKSGGGFGDEDGCYVDDDYVLIGHSYDEEFICFEFEEELICYDTQDVEYTLDLDDGVCAVTPIREPNTAGFEKDEQEECFFDEYGDVVCSGQGPGSSVDLEDIRSRIPGMPSDQESGGVEEQSLQGEESNYDKLGELVR